MGARIDIRAMCGRIRPWMSAELHRDGMSAGGGRQQPERVVGRWNSQVKPVPVVSGAVDIRTDGPQHSDPRDAIFARNDLGFDPIGPAPDDLWSERRRRRRSLPPRRVTGQQSCGRSVPRATGHASRWRLQSHPVLRLRERPEERLTDDADQGRRRLIQQKNLRAAEERLRQID